MEADFISREHSLGPILIALDGPMGWDRMNKCWFAMLVRRRIETDA
jgi:hypothetical protein